MAQSLNLLRYSTDVRFIPTNVGWRLDLPLRLQLDLSTRLHFPQPHKSSLLFATLAVHDPFPLDPESVVLKIDNLAVLGISEPSRFAQDDLDPLVFAQGHRIANGEFRDRERVLVVNGDLARVRRGVVDFSKRAC